MSKHEVCTVGRTGVPKTLADDLIEGGLPTFYGDQELNIVITSDDILNGVPRSCTDCAIALAIKRAFGSPWVVVGASFAYIALPDPKKGRQVPGFAGKWSVFAFETTTQSGHKAIKQNDLHTAWRDPNETAIVTLKPVRKSERSKGKAIRNAQNAQRKVFGTHASQPGKPRLVLEEGIRNFSGRSWKSAASS